MASIRRIKSDFLLLATAVLSRLLMFTSTCSAQEPVFLSSFTTRSHQVAGDLYVISERVLQIRNYVYDGDGPAAYFWIDASATPSSGGRVAADASPGFGCAMDIGDTRLPFANGITQNIELPEGTTITDYVGGSLSVWCERFAVNFGEALIPSSISVPAVDDALDCFEGEDDDGEEEDGDGEDIPAIAVTPEGFNCEPLNEDYQVRWRISGDNLDVELLGRIETGTYMGFGISGRPQTDTFMIGADAVVADMTESGPRVQDIFLDSRAQCNGVSGVCPDTEGGFVNDASNVFGEEDSGLTLIRYVRPLVPTDNGVLTSRGEPVDMTIPSQTGIETFIVWALGPMSDVGNPLFHTNFPSDNVSLDFGRSVVDNCPPLMVGEETDPPVEPFIRPDIGDTDGTTVFDCHIGPSGGPRGYEAITGEQSWGIAWYVNGSLIPKLVLRRGVTYTFRVNGGDNPTNDPKYHPFYLTDSPEGGYFQLSPSERLEENPLVGIIITNEDSAGVYDFEAIGTAPICEYTTTTDSIGAQLQSYDEYFATLDSSCASDPTILTQAVVLEFTPDDSTPDTIYYHCVTHRFLGYEIEVVGQAPVPVTPLPIQTAPPEEPPTEAPATPAPVQTPAPVAAPTEAPITVAPVQTPAPAAVPTKAPVTLAPAQIQPPVVAPTEAPVTPAPIQTPPPAATPTTMPDMGEVFATVPLTGQLEGATVRYRVNLADPEAWGQDTLSVVLETPALGWVGFAFNNNGGFMVGSEAIIGLPDIGDVRKYNLNAQGVSGVVPLPDEQQTLIDATITQTSAGTTLRFTKIMMEPNEIPVLINSSNTFLSAWGSSNTLGFHAAREPYTLMLEAPGETPSPVTSAGSTQPSVQPPTQPSMQPSVAPAQSDGMTQSPTEPAIDEEAALRLVPLTGQLEGATMKYRVTLEDPAANGERTITVVLETPASGWVGFGVSANGLMVGSEAIIGLPDTGEVKKYNLTQQAVGGVVPMAEDRQTLMDTNITQTSTRTTLTFTKIMYEEGEIPIKPDAMNTFLSAWGSSNTLGFHAAREPYNAMVSSAPAPPTAAPVQDPPTAAPVQDSPTAAPVQESPTSTEPPVQGTPIEQIKEEDSGSCNLGISLLSAMAVISGLVFVV